jgi:hypothetical protein
MSLKDWLPAIAVIGPIIAAVITLIATRRLRERKRLRFEITAPEDLTAPMRRQNVKFSIRYEEQDVDHFNRTVVRVQNSGNAPIKDVRFIIRTPGHHKMRTFNWRPYNDDKVIESLDANWLADPNDDALQVSAPFLNPKEMFGLALFFDGKPIASSINCRMEGVEVSTTLNTTISAYAAEAQFALIEAILKSQPLGILFQTTDRLMGGSVLERHQKLKKILNKN